MAVEILLKNDKDNTRAKAYIGFSWTVFFFSFFTPLFRKDYKGFFLILTLNIIFLNLLELVRSLKYWIIKKLLFKLKILTALSIGTSFPVLEVKIFLAIGFGIWIASWYNKYHMEELIKKGYRPIDEDNEKLLKFNGINF